MEPREHLITLDVEKQGWHVVRVTEGDEEPACAYSIGLYRTFSHPDLIIFGLPLKTMHVTIDKLANAVKAGQRYEPGDSSRDVFEGYECVFREVPRGQYEAHLAYAVWYYGGLDFPAIQVVWPDRAWRYPWQPGFDEELRPVQPVLAGIGPA